MFLNLEFVFIINFTRKTTLRHISHVHSLLSYDDVGVEKIQTLLLTSSWHIIVCNTCLFAIRELKCNRRGSVKFTALKIGSVCVCVCVCCKNIWISIYFINVRVVLLTNCIKNSMSCTGDRGPRDRLCCLTLCSFRIFALVEWEKYT